MTGTAAKLSLLAIALALASAPAGAQPTHPADDPIVLDLTDASVGDELLQGSPQDGMCVLPHHLTTMTVGDEASFLRVTYEVTDDCDLVVTDVCRTPTECARILPQEIARDVSPTASTSPTDVATLEYCAAWKKIRSAHRSVDQRVLGDYSITEVVENFKFEYGCSDNTANWLSGDSSSNCYTWESGWDIKNCYQDQPSAGTGCVSNGVTGEFERTDGTDDHWLTTGVEGCDDGSYTCTHDESSYTPGEKLESECNVSSQGQY